MKKNYVLDTFLSSKNLPPPMWVKKNKLPVPPLEVKLPESLSP